MRYQLSERFFFGILFLGMMLVFRSNFDLPRARGDGTFAIHSHNIGQ
jgi:hypothetical protein